MTTQIERHALLSNAKKHYANVRSTDLYYHCTCMCIKVVAAFRRCLQAGPQWRPERPNGILGEQ